MKKFCLKEKAIIGTAAIAAVAAPAANAAIDVSSVTSEIAATAAPIGLIGGAILVMWVGVKAYKWVRAAMS